VIRTVFVAACLALGLSAQASAAPVVIAPPASGAADPALAAVIDTLVKAAEARDFAPFEAAMTPEATASYGGDVGPAGFKAVYDVDSPQSPFWPAFLAAAKLGGVSEQDDLYTLPYTAGALPDEADPYLSVIAIGDRTALYAEPRPDAKVIADVTHQLLEQVDVEPEDYEKTGPDYIHVKVEAGTGYVKVTEARSPLDYRAVFQKIDGAWKLVAFVAGD